MKQILIVDDVAADLQSAVEVLKDSYDITARDSGQKALALLQDMQPDLILLDVNMPGMDGYEVMEELKKDRKLNEIPVIFLTSQSDQESEIKGLKMGAMDFVRKPFEPEVMRSRIDKILRLTEQNRELQKIALKDGLTDLLNRRYMEKLLNQTDINEENGYFLLFDLDNFKLVNDNFGHIVGDEVLIKFARVLQEEVGPEDSVCRLGGDEFAIYVSSRRSRDEVKRMARRMIAGIEYEINDMLLDSCNVKVSVSIGIAEKPSDGDEFTKLYGAADKALYYVKQNGKRGYHFFHDGKIDYEKAEEDNHQINLLQLQRLVQERGHNSGAYRVGYEGFKRIYRFVTRCMERKRQDVQLVLFTVQDAAGGDVRSDMMERGIATLEKAVTQSLRRGDVATKCGTAQYVVILMNTSSENGDLVANRICSKFTEVLGDGTMALTYEIQSAGRIKTAQQI
ncbi:MAG: diguanylate cyclase [Lachnospiraceae bacterium]|nr:diguanylate cyclase [Lachnospiraceae bacterium]